MNKEQQGIKIAEACGFTDVKPLVVKNVKHKGDDKQVGIWSEQGWIPDYLNDLNAMHEAEELCGEFYSIRSCVYDDWLSCVIGHEQKWRATAAQRAEAFLKTLGLWEEES